MAVVRLAGDQIERAAELLGRAFVDDPLAVHMSPSGAARASGLPQHFGATARYAHLVGEVHVTPEPPASRCRRRACTAGVQRSVARRTVSPTRTAAVTRPPRGRSVGGTVRSSMRPSYPNPDRGAAQFGTGLPHRSSAISI
jgi:hypothetical protein